MRHQREVYPRGTLWRRLIVTQLVLVLVLIAFTIEGGGGWDTAVRILTSVAALAVLVYELLQWRWESGDHG